MVIEKLHMVQKFVMLYPLWYNHIDLVHCVLTKIFPGSSKFSALYESKKAVWNDMIPVNQNVFDV